MFCSATLTKVDNPKRNHTVGNLWWNKGSPPRQATLALKRGSTDMNSMFSNMKQHPLAVGSDGKSNWMMLEVGGPTEAKGTTDRTIFIAQFPWSLLAKWATETELC